MNARRIAFLMSSIVVACGDVDGAEAPIEAPIGARPLIDVDPAADRIEVSLVAGPAKWTYLPGKAAADVWAYRDDNDPADLGQIPGPAIVGRVGDHVTVHFRSELPEPTTIHWHGLRVAASHDGSNVSQSPVEPGGAFTYEFTLTDAGTFWFHPHLDGDVQIERGLYAPIIVRGDDEVGADADRLLVLDDVKLESTGALSTTITSLDLMVGRQGNVLLVNGARQPRLDAAVGARERWRLLNTANGTYFNVALPGRSLRVIAWDGGLLPEPYEADSLLIAPGERYELLVDLDGVEGDEIELRTLHYDRGHELPDLGPRTLATFVLGPPPTHPRPDAPARWGTVAPLPDTATRREFVLREEEPADPSAEPRFYINDEAFPLTTPVISNQGDLEIWELRNDAEMDHPFHLHGTFFQVLDAPHLGWKDTVNVPMKSTVRFAVRLDNPGEWMFHCHILEHAERGMMGVLHVLEASP
ncbi:MAG: multicopper oxidase family protein [Nannocystaceae bacterium]|nr:multicopper oxidase family protein [Myxococcales bacterium]